MDAEAWDARPKGKDQQSKVAMKEIPITNRFPYMHNEVYQIMEEVAQRGCGISNLGDIQCYTGQCF